MRAISVLLLAFLLLVAATGWLYHKRFERHLAVEAIAREVGRIERYEQQLAAPELAPAERARLRLGVADSRRRVDRLRTEIAGLDWLW